jgi:chromosome segregation ATPase
MDINQAARMIEWLDEERRRDKSMIATMEERLAQQQDVIDALQKRLNSVESDQTIMRNQFVPTGRDLDMQEQMRKEMRQMIEQIEAKRLTAEREAERRAELSRENMLRPVRELEERMTSVARQTGEMPVLQMDRERFASSITILQQRVDDIYKKLEEPDRRLAFLEEQRRQDVRRVSEMETEMPEIKKQVDSIRPKISLIEDLSLRNERRAQEITNSDRERREQIQQFIDQQTLLLQQRDQQVEELLRRFGDQDDAMQRNMERFETWEETYRSMKNIIDDFNRIGDRLERRINEVAEMQRLSEERFRQEWNNWRADDQKRWKQFTLSNDEVWRGHDKDFERFVTRMDEIVEQLGPLHDSLARLWQLERERAQLYRERYQSLLSEFDTPVGNKRSTGTMTAVTSTSTNPIVKSTENGNGTTSMTSTSTNPIVGNNNGNS